jgi:Ca-activated chloride channel family protein
MKRIISFLVVVIMVLFCGNSAGALGQDGVISGTVITEDGSAVPGVTVILTGNNVVGKRTTITAESGVFRFPALPPGEYKLRFELEGFNTLVYDEIPVKPGENVKINVVMKLSNMQEQVLVYGKAPVIDRRKSSSTTTYHIDGSRPSSGRSHSRRSKRTKRYKYSAQSHSPQCTKKQPRKYSKPQPPQPPRAPVKAEDYSPINDSRFKRTGREPLSTFSIDVDTASYANVRRIIKSNQLPVKDAVRIEEMVNYFKYDYPQPEGEHPFSIVTEVAGCPWNMSRRLVHIGLQGRKMKSENRKPNNLVFLLDVSGSMDAPNKLPLLKTAFKLLVKQLDDRDRVAIVVYAGAAGLVLPSTQGFRQDKIFAAIDNLRAGGSTAGCAGIQLAYKTAVENFIRYGNNRIILATDGDFNVGVSSTPELVKMIEEKRKQGIFLTILGFGMGNLKDSRMEQLADKGNGSYHYIDNLLEAKKVFVDELNATLFTIAKDVKIQVEFNPAKVKAYRLVGYVNRLLNEEDFDDDKKDAGELGAGHTVTALYEIIPARSPEPVPGASKLRYQVMKTKEDAVESGEIMTVKLRYKRPKGNKSKLIVRAVMDEDVSLRAASDNFRFSAAVAQFGLLLRDSEFKGKASYNNVLRLARGAKGRDYYGYRAEFIKLVETCQLLSSSIARR